MTLMLLRCSNQQSYTAIVKTVDNTPPTFVSVNATAQFTSFTLNTFLDEPSAVVGLLVRRADEVNVTLPQLLQGAFPPDVQVRQMWSMYRRVCQMASSDACGHIYQNTCISGSGKSDGTKVQ